MRSLSSALTATLLLGLSAAVAQNSAPMRWAEGAPNATSDVENDHKIEGLKTDDIHIFVSFADVKETEYNRVWVQISNHGKAPVDFNPQSALLLKGDKTVRPEVPDKAANSIQKFGEAESQEMSSANCNMMASSGHSSPVPHAASIGAGGAGCGANDSQVQMGKQVAAFSAQQAEWVRNNALSRKALAPGEEAQGAIVFRKDKKPADYILRITVGSETFEFPVSAQNKRPSYD
ncbi:MAG TPA: hypothetical protein VMD99_02460 [Terriglobales bacterium]|nr:hypothetical protein [Terriglobales bacterium]